MAVQALPTCPCARARTIAPSVPGGRRPLDLSVTAALTSTLVTLCAKLQSGEDLAIDERTRHVFVADAFGHVAMLDAASGAVLRTTRIGTSAGQIEVDAVANRVYVSMANPNSLVILSARSGALLRMIRLPVVPGLIELAPHLDRLIIATSAGGPRSASLTIFDTRHQSVLRTVPMRPDMAQMAVDEQTAHVVVANTLSNTVDVLDARTGRFLHTITVAIAPTSTVISPATGRIFVIGRAGLAVLDERTERVMRTVLNGISVSMIIVAAPTARAFVLEESSVESQLYILDAHTGTLLHHIDLDPQHKGDLFAGWVIDAHAKRVYMLRTSPLGRDEIPYGPASIAILDAATGSMHRHITLGIPIPLGIGAIAFDAPTHGLFVLTDNSVLVLNTVRL